MKISDHYQRLWRTWNYQAKSGEIPDSENPMFLFATTDKELLKKIANGELDVQQLALLELDSRREVRTSYRYDKKGNKIKHILPW